VPAIHWINRPTFQQVVQIGNFDHFKCYKVARPQAPDPGLVTLTDGFESRATRVLRLDSICNPVDKNGEGISDPMRRLACWKIKNDTIPSPRRTIGRRRPAGERHARDDAVEAAVLRGGGERLACDGGVGRLQVLSRGTRRRPVPAEDGAAERRLRVTRRRWCGAWTACATRCR
jgi:hypothetical protein